MGIGGVEVDWLIPLLASETPQAFRFDTALIDLTMADQLWNLFDGAGTLDRGPAGYRLDMNGTAVITTDLLDINALMALEQTGELPLEVPEINIESFEIKALGAEVAADGAIALDWSTMPFMGAPMPSGTLNMTAEGLTAAMQSLVDAGLMAAQDTMPVVMGLGMVAQQTGEDSYESVIELREDGSLFANGQQLQ